MSTTWKYIGIIVCLVIVTAVIYVLNPKKLVVVEDIDETSESAFIPTGVCLKEKMSDEETQKLSETKGRTFGYIRDVETTEAGTVVLFDEASFLMFHDGSCALPTSEGPWEGNDSVTGKPICNPNGFAIENKDQTARTFPITQGATLVGSYACPSVVSIAITPEELKEKVDERMSYGDVGLPVNVVFEEDVVVSIFEQYLP